MLREQFLKSYHDCNHDNVRWIFPSGPCPADAYLCVGSLQALPIYFYMFTIEGWP